MRKKVLNIVPQLDFGGIEKRCEYIAQHIGRSNSSHSFLALSHVGAAAEVITSCGLSVTCLREPRHIFSPKLIHKIYKEIQSQRPDVVHTRGVRANLNGLIAAKIAGVKCLICEEVGVSKNSFKLRIALRFVYKISSGVIAISPAVEREIIESGKAPAKKIYTVYNPVVSPRASREKICWSGLRIGFVGRLEKVKNAIALIEATRMLFDSGINVRLEIVGDGSQKRALESATDALGLRDRVRFHGFSAEPFEKIKQCNVYVQPSISEGFGLAIVEAGLSGFPLIVTGSSGLKEFVKDGENGLILKSPSADQVFEALKIFNNLTSEKKKEMGVRASIDFRRKFNIEDYLRYLDNLYEDVSEASI